MKKIREFGFEFSESEVLEEKEKFLKEVDWWRGDHGDEYTKRNAGIPLEARMMMWGNILDCLEDRPDSFLEIGAGGGINLLALRAMGYDRLSGIEPNAQARAVLEEGGFPAYDGTAESPGRGGDLVFTSGVLIHVHPDELLEACRGIHRAAGRYIVCIEYFSADPEEKPYRGRNLWKRDFGTYWMEHFDLRAMGCGFEWKFTTGLDNLTWWVFGK